MASRKRLESAVQKSLVAQKRLRDWTDDEAKMHLGAAKVSAWRVGWHVEHLSMTATLITEFLEKFVEVGGEKSQGGPNFVGWLVLLTRFIPRGSADVPDFLCPLGVDLEALAQELESTQVRLEKLSTQIDQLATTPGTQPHPLLGHFTVLQWFDFLVIHDHHHYKIIRDIERASSGASSK